MMRSVEKSNERTRCTDYKIHHCAISEGKSSASHMTLFYSSQFYKCFKQAEKRGVTVIGIKNVMSAKKFKRKYMASDRYQNLNKRMGKMKRPNLQIAFRS